MHLKFRTKSKAHGAWIPGNAYMIAWADKAYFNTFDWSLFVSVSFDFYKVFSEGRM